nr:hypothetical protein [Bacteroidota bacterium]
MKVSALISNTLSDISVSHVSCVPGFGGSQVYDAWNEIHNIKLPYSFHEEVAFAVSHGVALSGKRAAMLTKSHGLAKAANAVVDSLYAGINAGFVIFVFHDETGSHSDNILDSETLIRGLRIPYEKPSKKQLQQAIVNSFERSEKDKIPVALMLDACIVDDDHEYIKMSLRLQQFTFTRNIVENLVVPVFAKYQYNVVNAKLAGQNWHNIRLPN